MKDEFLTEVKELIAKGGERAEFWEDYLRRDFDDIEMDLKTPCDDCPFRSDVYFHEGIFGSLDDYEKSFESGEFAHTCHKTDKRADGFEKSYKKEHPQHCAGMLIMAKKMGKPTRLMKYAEALGEPLEGLDDNAPVFSSMEEMREHYDENKPRFIRKNFTTPNGAQISVRYARD